MYVIITGEYSDWDIVGYFGKEEDAKKYCLINNDPHDDYYYIEIKKLDLTKKQREVKLYCRHKVVFDLGRDGYFEMREESEECDYDLKEYTNEPAKYNLSDNYDSGWISYKINCSDRKKAEKIAQDKLTKLQGLMLDLSFKQALIALGYEKR
jgi:hypothetical protein